MLFFFYKNEVMELLSGVFLSRATWYFIRSYNVTSVIANGEKT